MKKIWKALEKQDKYYTASRSMIKIKGSKSLNRKTTVENSIGCVQILCQLGTGTHLKLTLQKKVKIFKNLWEKKNLTKRLSQKDRKPYFQ